MVVGPMVYMLDFGLEEQAADMRLNLTHAFMGQKDGAIILSREFSKSLVIIVI